VVDRRLAARTTIDLQVACRIPATLSSARILDVSRTGCRLAPRVALQPGQSLLIRLDRGREVDGSVIWSNRALAGVRFTLPLSVEALDYLISRGEAETQIIAA